MKANKWLVVVVLAVIVIGSMYGGLSYVENRVVTAVRRVVHEMDNASVGSVRFTLSDRKLVITDVAATLHKDSSLACSIKFKAVEAVLPWDLILSSKFEGSVLVAETLDMQGVEYILQGRDDIKIVVDKERAREVRTDLALLQRFWSNKMLEAAELVAACEHSSMNWAEMEGVVVSNPNGVISIEKIIVERMDGLQIGNQRGTGFTASVALEPQTTPENVLELASFSAENINFPVDALHLLIEMSTVQSPSDEQMNALMQTMFYGKIPLVGGIEMHNLKVAEKIFPASVRFFRLDWPSSAPLRYVAALDGLTVPTDAIAQQFGMQLPHLPEMEVSIRTEEESDAQGRISVHDVYRIKDLFNLDARVKFVAADAGSKGVPSFPFWKVDRMENTMIAGFDLELEDKNLMAYALLNIEGPQATGDGLIGLLSQWPGTSKEGHKKMIDSLAMFIKQPGTLNVNFTPENPVTFFQFLEMLYDPSAVLTFSSTPGEAPVQDVIKKIHELSGK